MLLIISRMFHIFKKLFHKEKRVKSCISGALTSTKKGELTPSAVNRNKPEFKSCEIAVTALDSNCGEKSDCLSKEIY